ncbi:MAG: ankyrin repeat domain-containing protein [Bacteroidota bacterium]
MELESDNLKSTRSHQIQDAAGEGQLEILQSLLDSSATQIELDVALEMAIAYSQLETADYLLSLGADFSNYNYQGVYYAVHNSELEGLKYAIEKGVDINVEKGMILNKATLAAVYSKQIDIVKWVLDSGADINLLRTENLETVNEFGTEELRSIINEAPMK